MKYTIELICDKGNTLREIEGTEKTARAYARNLLIKKGKEKWMAVIYKDHNGALTKVGKMYYYDYGDNGNWYFDGVHDLYKVKEDGSIRKILWK